MKLTQFEQSGFIIETDSGYKLAIDIGSYTPLEKLEGIAVDSVFVSHIHKDHFSSDQIMKLAPKKLYMPEECANAFSSNDGIQVIVLTANQSVDPGPTSILPFDVDHGPNISVVPKQNLGFLIEADGQRIYFAGDMFYPSGIDVSGLEVDYALIPVGTFYTFGPEDALAFIKRFKKIGKIIPMHYQKTPETKEEFETLAVANNLPI